MCSRLPLPSLLPPLSPIELLLAGTALLMLLITMIIVVSQVV
jgi:hypothetical protein